MVDLATAPLILTAYYAGCQSARLKLTAQHWLTDHGGPDCLFCFAIRARCLLQKSDALKTETKVEDVSLSHTTNIDAMTTTPRLAPALAAAKRLPQESIAHLVVGLRKCFCKNVCQYKSKHKRYMQHDQEHARGHIPESQPMAGPTICFVLPHELVVCSRNQIGVDHRSKRSWCWTISFS